MDNDEIEKYKREVEQNQMREQGLFVTLISFDKFFLHSAFKKNALLDEIRKGIKKNYLCFNTLIYLICFIFSLGSKKLQTKSTNITTRTGVQQTSFCFLLGNDKHDYPLLPAHINKS